MELSWRKLDTYAKAYKTNAYIIFKTLQGIQEGKKPNKAFRDAAEDENAYGSRPDIVAERRQAIKLLRDKYNTKITRDLLRYE